MAFRDEFCRPPFFDDLYSDPCFKKIFRELEARRGELREEVRRLGIDLYPPGSGAGLGKQSGRTDGGRAAAGARP